VLFSSSRRRHTTSKRDWSSDVCSSDLHRTGFDRVALGSVRVPVPRPGQTPEEPPGPGAGVSPASGPPQTVAVAVSRQECHWVETEPSDSDHGHGRQGAATAGAVLTVASIVRGAAEIRVVRAEGA